MKKNKNFVIFIIISVVIIAIVVAIMIINGIFKNNINSPENNNEEIQGSGDTEEQLVEEFVSILEDGTKYNISEKLKEPKTVIGMETLKLENIQVTSKELQTVILADVTNTSNTNTDIVPVEIVLYGKDGNEITSFNSVISPTNSNEKEQLNATISADYANVYDFKITKK